MKSFDVITVGNAVLDIFLSIHDANIHCRLNEETCELCVRSGEKIQVDKCVLEVGGDAANVAVGISRMGFSSALMAEIGDDEFTQKILHTLSQEKVDSSLIQKTQGMASSFSVGINFKGERTLFVEHIKRRHNFTFEDIETQWVYLTSLGNEWEYAYNKTLSFIAKRGAKLAFNPGTLQIQAGAGKIADLLKKTDILFLNKEEAGRIASGISNDEKTEIKKLLQILQQTGPKVVVITDGKNGSYAIDVKGDTYSLGGYPCEVVERTGAGDAYSTGFLTATIEGLSTLEAMQWGTVNAGAVIGKIGAQAGLLTKDVIKQKVAEWNI